MQLNIEVERARYPRVFEVLEQNGWHSGRSHQIGNDWEDTLKKYGFSLAENAYASDFLRSFGGLHPVAHTKKSGRRLSFSIGEIDRLTSLLKRLDLPENLPGVIRQAAGWPLYPVMVGDGSAGFVFPDGRMIAIEQAYQWCERAVSPFALMHWYMFLERTGVVAEEIPLENQSKEFREEDF